MENQNKRQLLHKVKIDIFNQVLVEFKNMILVQFSFGKVWVPISECFLNKVLVNYCVWGIYEGNKTYRAIKGDKTYDLNVNAIVGLLENEAKTDTVKPVEKIDDLKVW